MRIELLCLQERLAATKHLCLSTARQAAGAQKHLQDGRRSQGCVLQKERRFKMEVYVFLDSSCSQQCVLQENGSGQIKMYSRTMASGLAGTKANLKVEMKLVKCSKN